MVHIKGFADCVREKSAKLKEEEIAEVQRRRTALCAPHMLGRLEAMPGFVLYHNVSLRVKPGFGCRALAGQVDKVLRQKDFRIREKSIHAVPEGAPGAEKAVQEVIPVLPRPRPLRARGSPAVSTSRKHGA